MFGEWCASSSFCVPTHAWAEDARTRDVGRSVVTCEGVNGTCMRVMHEDTFPARLPSCSGDALCSCLELGVELAGWRGVAPVATAS